MIDSEISTQKEYLGLGLGILEISCKLRFR
jgi:hypothetical protein